MIKDGDNLAEQNTSNTPARPRKGRGGTHNFPNAIEQPKTPEEKLVVSTLLKECLEAYHMPKVNNDEELADRLDQYFIRCGDRHIKPTVEEMCLYTGYTTGWMKNIECGNAKGFSDETFAVIKKAKEILKTFDAKMVTDGKQNPIVYFFRAKNYYGMRDQQEIVVEPKTREASDYNAEEIAKRYLSEKAPIDVEPSD